MLKVVGTCEASEFPSNVDFDEHVPVRFRSHSGPIGGARYIRLGNLSTSLLELRVPSESMALRSFSLTLIDRVSTKKLCGNAEFEYGLPVLELPEGSVFQGPISAQRADIKEEISAYLDLDGFVISIGEVVDYDRALKHGRISFFISNDALIGICIAELRSDERGLAASYLGSLA